MTDKSNEEIALVMGVEEDATNIQVATALEKVFRGLFSKTEVKAIVCKILPNEHKIYIKPFIQLNIKKVDSWFEVNTTLKDENQEDWILHFSFMFAENIVDAWNKFMPMEFVIRIDDKDPYTVKIGWDCGLSKEQVKAYWFSNNSDGYNTEAKFWSREWLREEHKLPSTGGGKVN